MPSKISAATPQEPTSSCSNGTVQKHVDIGADLSVSHASDYFIAEMQSLREELREQIQEEVLLQRNVLIACAAIWAFLLTQNAGPFTHVAAFCPFLVSLFAFAKVRMIQHAVARLSDYLKALENKLGICGWESHVRTHGASKPFSSITAYWTLLVIVMFASGTVFLIIRLP